MLILSTIKYGLDELVKIPNIILLILWGLVTFGAFLSCTFKCLVIHRYTGNKIKIPYRKFFRNNIGSSNALYLDDFNIEEKEKLIEYFKTKNIKII